MFKILKNTPPNVFGVEMTGKVTKEELEAMDVLVENHAAENPGDLKFLMVLKDFEWNDFEAFWADLKMDLKYLGQVSKTAVVTEQTWLENLSKVIKALSPKMKVKIFDLEEREDADRWLLG